METGAAVLTPPQLAKRWRVKVTKVLGWIRSGELRAINLATKATRKPRWKIRAEDVEAFELLRASNEVQKPSRARRAKLPATKEYF